ncbi:hypothetical protein FBY40_2117 [Microbacterium sp. SLBN-154]|uniref:SMP-30/gluconolactonase/LRE family protein n=1 Tax=Microbacterium sp. SLBN-154 TaxID=2768458 RepID=UPI00115294D0|nr:superoxide dismutase [Microbacterium sp. SLBN-154]TQK19613.1 hypothetical protein FBY40_2117 [Microbacterium sp. SLBN-154]
MTRRRFALVLPALAVAGLLAALPATGAVAAPPVSRGGAVDQIALPDGFQPEGIAIDNRGIAYFGSLVDGDIYAADVRTGKGAIVSEGPGIPAAGLKVDQRGRLFISGGPTGIARVVDTETGDEVARYQLTAPGGFINDVVLARDGAWFTNSSAAELYFLPIPRSGVLPDPSEIVTLPLTGEWVQQEGFNANGIALTTNRQALLVIQSATGTLFRVDPETGVATTVDLGGFSLQNGDGLLVVNRTLYVVQNRLNQVAEFRLDVQGTSGTLENIITSEAFRVPTTVASYRQDLYLPNARFGTPPTPTTDYDAVRVDR